MPGLDLRVPVLVLDAEERAARAGEVALLQRIRPLWAIILFLQLQHNKFTKGGKPAGGD